MSLLLVRDDVDVHRCSLHLSSALSIATTEVTYSCSSATELFAQADTFIHSPLNITLKTLVKVFEHGRATRKHNILYIAIRQYTNLISERRFYLVKTSANIDRAGLDDGIDNFREGRQKV